MMEHLALPSNLAGHPSYGGTYSQTHINFQNMSSQNLFFNPFILNTYVTHNFICSLIHVEMN